MGLFSGRMRTGAQATDSLDGAVKDRRIRCSDHPPVNERFNEIDDWEAASYDFAEDCVGDSNCDLHGWRFPCRVHRQPGEKEQRLAVARPER